MKTAQFSKLVSGAALAVTLVVSSVGVYGQQGQHGRLERPASLGAALEQNSALGLAALALAAQASGLSLNAGQMKAAQGALVTGIVPPAGIVFNVVTSANKELVSGYDNVWTAADTERVAPASAMALLNGLRGETNCAFANDAPASTDKESRDNLNAVAVDVLAFNMFGKLAGAQALSADGVAKFAAGEDARDNPEVGAGLKVLTATSLELVGTEVNAALADGSLSETERAALAGNMSCALYRGSHKAFAQQDPTTAGANAASLVGACGDTLGIPNAQSAPLTCTAS